MSVIQWSDEYLTGAHWVDKQHQRLFEMVNELHQAVVEGRAKDVTTDIMNTLERYLTLHFGAEQRLMESMGYPGTIHHRRQHEALEAKARDFIQQHREGRVLLGLSVSQFLGQWLGEHVVVEDKRMMNWVRTSPSSRDGSPEPEERTLDTSSVEPGQERESGSRLKPGVDDAEASRSSAAGGKKP